MKTGSRCLAFLGCVFLLAACSSEQDPVSEDGPGEEQNPPSDPADPSNLGIQLPDGFSIDVFASGLDGVRTLKLGPDGFLYAVLSDQGQIVRLSVPGGAAGSTLETVATGLNRPYGLAFHQGALYVGETNRIVRLSGDGFDVREVIVDGLPTGGHWTREILFGSDGMLYLSVGSRCNICEEVDARRAAVTRYAPDGSGETVIAQGLRNSAGMAWHVETDALWVSQNERDHLGDDLPPEEINIIEVGAHYGWPFCYGRGIPNPEYGDPQRCETSMPPALEMQAHSAPLGMVFYDGEQFPEEYRGDLFLAFHGSWNRSVPTGYKLVRIRVEDGRPVGYEDFASGWLRNRSVTGRPVYPAVGPDGSLYLSDDGVDRIYRIWYRGQG